MTTTVIVTLTATTPPDHDHDRVVTLIVIVPLSMALILTITLTMTITVFDDRSSFENLAFSLHSLPSLVNRPPRPPSMSWAGNTLARPETRGVWGHKTRRPITTVAKMVAGRKPYPSHPPSWPAGGSSGGGSRPEVRLGSRFVMHQIIASARSGLSSPS